MFINSPSDGATYLVRVADLAEAGAVAELAGSRVQDRGPCPGRESALHLEGIMGGGYIKHNKETKSKMEAADSPRVRKRIGEGDGMVQRSVDV